MLWKRCWIFSTWSGMHWKKTFAWLIHLKPLQSWKLLSEYNSIIQDASWTCIQMSCVRNMHPKSYLMMIMYAMICLDFLRTSTVQPSSITWFFKNNLLDLFNSCLHGNTCLGSLVNVNKRYFILLVLRLLHRIVELSQLPCSHNGPKQKTETFSWPGLETAPVGPKKTQLCS